MSGSRRYGNTTWKLPGKSTHQVGPLCIREGLVVCMGGGGGTDVVEGVILHAVLFCRVRIVASVPGAHTGKNMHKWGHMKLRKVKQNQSLSSDTSLASFPGHSLFFNV